MSRIDYKSIDDYEEGKEYTQSELDMLASKLLWKDTRRELCGECEEYGEDVGIMIMVPLMNEEGEFITDGEGGVVMVHFNLLVCSNDHAWFPGENKARGIDGDNPILFEEHIIARHTREIYTSVGTPDPSVESGLYNRTHPQGRKTSTPKQRKQGSAYYL